jgi:similar to spore coat protein
MVNPDGLAVHESLELHELLVFRNLCCTKASTMQMLVTDPQLKAIMQRDVSTTTEHLRELRDLLNNSQLQ